MHRALAELINISEPALPIVMEWVAAATNDVRVLPCAGRQGDDVLLHLQVTTRSPMGAIAHGTGGILVDSGWVRVLGGGSAELPRTITTWNQMSLGRAERVEGAILVGDDAVGGFFALSGGGIPVSLGKVGYLAPDTLEWEDSNLGYTDWLRWLLTGDLEQYYGSHRWPGWREEVRALSGDRAFSIYPFLWAAGPPVDERSRAAVPVEELWRLNAVEFRAFFRGGG